MSRDSNGDYTLPAGNPVVAGSVIESSWANTTLSDIAVALTDSLSRSGQGGMTAVFKAIDGSEANPGIVWAGALTTGFYRASANSTGYSASGVNTVQFDQTGVTAPSGYFFNGRVKLTASGALSPGILSSIDSTSGLFLRPAGSAEDNFGYVRDGVTIFEAGVPIGGSTGWMQVSGSTQPMYEIIKPGNAAYGMYVTSNNSFALAQTNGDSSIVQAFFSYLSGAHILTGSSFNFSNAAGSTSIVGTTASTTNSTLFLFHTADGVNRSSYRSVMQATGASLVSINSDYPTPNGWVTQYDSNRHFIVANKGYQPGGGTWLDSSDARIKRDIEDWNLGLEAILALRPRQFRFIPELERGDELFVSLIAQEAEGTPLGPLLVDVVDGMTIDPTVEGGVPFTLPGGIKTLDSTAVTWALVNAVKELYAMIPKSGGIE